MGGNDIYDSKDSMNFLCTMNNETGHKMNHFNHQQMFLARVQIKSKLGVIFGCNFIRIFLKFIIHPMGSQLLANICH